jgi:pyridoxal phosphate enzyme (YggS family)
MFYVPEFQKNIVLLHSRISAACNSAQRTASDVKIVAVTKTHPVETAQAAIDAGLSDIGENRVQEIQEKAPVLAGKRTIHLIGHLQSNKVNKAVPLVDWIQSIDSIDLLKKVDSACEKCQKKINILIQVNTSGEQTKSGCTADDALRLSETAASCRHVSFCGFMTIGPLTADEKQIRASFSALRKTGEQCRGMADKIELSMGMSHDFVWAIEEGSTIIRVGSVLFGERPKNIP